MRCAHVPVEKAAGPGNKIDRFLYPCKRREHHGQSSHATYEFLIAGEPASSAARSSTPRKPLETDLVTATSLKPLTAKYHISSPFFPVAGHRLAISVGSTLIFVTLVAFSVSAESLFCHFVIESGGNRLNLLFPKDRISQKSGSRHLVKPKSGSSVSYSRRSEGGLQRATQGAFHGI